MPAFPRFTALAQSLPPTVPFVGPETQERARGAEFTARLGANESGFGPAPSVIEAIGRAAPLSWRYADPENHDLRIALGNSRPPRIYPQIPFFDPSKNSRSSTNTRTKVSWKSARFNSSAIESARSRGCVMQR